MEREQAARTADTLEETCQLIYHSRPRLRFCEKFDETSSLWNYARHSHPYIELIYYLDGKGNVEISGNNVSFSLYDTIVYPAHQEHMDENISEKRQEIICLWVDIPELVFEKPLRLHEHNSTMKNAFELVYQEAKREKPEELAALEHISTSYLSRKFKQRTGMPVVSYINCLRIEKARQLLMASRLDIGEIAYQTGFESPKYFHRVFKELTGESPASFRRHYKLQS